MNDSQEREAFEKVVAPILGDNPNWRESGDCELAWLTWQARTALSSPPASALVAWMTEAQAEDMMREFGCSKHADCRDLVLAAYSQGRIDARASPPAPPALAHDEPAWIGGGEWIGCQACDISFPCHDGKERCLRLPRDKN